MTVRVYVDPPVPLETLSDKNKRQRILLERKNVDKVVLNSKFIDFYVTIKKLLGLVIAVLKLYKESLMII